MPLVKAFPLGLPLIGTTLVALADGKTHSKFIANSSVSITGDVNDSNAWKTGIVILEPSSTDILLGMEFFRTFGKTLVVYASRQQVRLIDDVEIANP